MNSNKKSIVKPTLTAAETHGYLAGRLCTKLNELQQSGGYRTYLQNLPAIPDCHSDMQAALSGLDTEPKMCGVISARQAITAWTGLPVNDRLEILARFVTHMERHFPVSNRCLKTMVFCKVFMLELVPIITGENN